VTDAQVSAGAGAGQENSANSKSWFDKALEKEILYMQGPHVYFDGQTVGKGKVAAKLAIEANLGLFNTIQSLVS
jgi:hypothetical protein